MPPSTASNREEDEIFLRERSLSGRRNFAPPFHTILRQKPPMPETACVRA